MIFIEHTKKLCSHVISKIINNSIKTYWWNKVPNFGDRITPLLLRHYGFIPVHSSEADAEIIMVGSILQRLPETYNGMILGAGLIKDIRQKFSSATILSLRGELTKRNLGIKDEIILGDPGLLAGKIIQKRAHKEYKLGIIPHFFDKDNQAIIQIYKKYPHEVCMIDVAKPPIKVFEAIDRCEFILSSSLHGLVVADALNIPNAWLVLSNKVARDGFKYYDYASIFGGEYISFRISGEENLDDLINFTHKVNTSVVNDIIVKLENLFFELPNTISDFRRRN